MTKKFWSMVMGVSLLMLSAGCSEGTTPIAPSNSAMNVLHSGSGAMASTTSEEPVVTLMPDLTASPSQVTVRAGYEIIMVNNSGRYRTIRSYNCSEFNMMNVPDGGWQYSSVFRPAGKTCNYFAWDVNWSRKILEGQVTVVP